MGNSHVGEIVLTEQQIQAGVDEVANQLNRQFSGAVVITVVPGGILFTADIVRRLNFDIKMDYISCPHTPGVRDNQSAIIFHQNISLKGADVILIDDAIESGGTMKRLVAHIRENYSVKSLSVATLFVKPSRISIPANLYYAYEMGNEDLLVGYGLPWEDQFRNVPYISKVIK